MGENFVEKFGIAENVACEAVSNITDVARALRRVGSPLANELFEATDALSNAHRAMAVAINEELSRQVKAADHHIAEAVLASLRTLGGR